MDVRKKMVNYRSRWGFSLKYMAGLCGISEGLLRIIEEGAVTVPGIVQRIQERYGLTDLEAEELLPNHRRLHGGDYDPDRYVSPYDLNDHNFTY